MKKITILAAVVALLGSCAQNTEDTINPNNKAEGRTIYATFDNEEEETKTYVENYKYLRWHAGDEISFFDATTHNSQYAFAGKDGDAEGEFNAVTTGSGEALATTYGVYPYNANTSISAEGVLSVELPAIQAYGVNSFGKGANTMVAVGESATDDKLFFKNACGYLVVKLYNESGATVKSVVLKGNNEEKIAGSATITTTNIGVPSVAMADSATTSVTIDCGDGVEIGTTAETATEFWFALPEITFESGIIITATDTEGKEFEKTTTKPVAITRNNVQPMKALGAEFKATKPANNEIWYTANEMITPAEYTTVGAAFGSSIISHSFDETTGCGIIQFETDLKIIGEDAFYNSLLSSITLPSSIEQIGRAAFHGCAYLNTIYLPQSLSYISQNAFYNCQCLQHIYIEDVASWCNVGMYGEDSCPSHYGAYFYLNDERITSLVIPSNVTTIKAYTFRSAQIDEIIISDGVATLGLNAFKGCSAKRIYIPQSVTDLGCKTFEHAYGELEINCECISKYIATGTPFYQNFFSKITIGEQVTTLEDYIFNNNSSVVEIKIGANVTSIGDYAFYYTPKLALIEGPYVSTDKRSIVVDNKLIAFAPANINEYSVPEGVIELRDYVMSYDNLTSITLPSSVETIGNGAFHECTSLEELYCKALNPPTTGSSILGSTNNYKIYVPYESLATYKEADGWIDYADYIVGYDFENNVVVKDNPDDNEFWYTTTDELPLEISSGAFNASITSHSYSNGKGVVIFNDSITSINDSAFYNQTKLNSVSLPNSITSIGAGAFAGSGLTSFTFPTSLTNIGYCALSNCPISTIVCNVTGSVEIGRDWDYYRYEGIGRLPNLAKVEGSCATSDNICLIIDGHLAAFAGKNQSSYTIPSNVRYIDSYVFADCEMESLTLHSNVSVYANAFYGANINMLTIPNGVWEYDNSFYMCYGNAYIDNQNISGTSEDTYGPYELSYFNEVTIGPNVKSIGENAFGRVQTIYCKPTTPPSCWARPFGSVTTIYVPKGYLSVYQSANYWSDFASMMKEY